MSDPHPWIQSEKIELESNFLVTEYLTHTTKGQYQSEVSLTHDRTLVFYSKIILFLWWLQTFWIHPFRDCGMNMFAVTSAQNICSFFPQRDEKHFLKLGLGTSRALLWHLETCSSTCFQSSQVSIYKIKLELSLEIWNEKKNDRWCPPSSILRI